VVRKNSVVGNEEVYDYDEISASFAVRYMSSMEAYMRLMSYPIVQMSHQIYSLSVHEENGQTIIFEEGMEHQAGAAALKDTRLTSYFKLCRGGQEGSELAKTLRYDEIPYYFWFAFF